MSHGNGLFFPLFAAAFAEAAGGRRRSRTRRTVAECLGRIDWDDVKAEMEAQDWEDDGGFMADGGSQTRRVYLGSVFSLSPSGKYYMPWATSVLEPCRECRGVGALPPHRRRRIAKKWLAKADPRRAAFARADKCHLHYPDIADLPWYRAYRRYLKRVNGRACRRCGGCGCREAHLDELFREELEAKADEFGFGIENGEGDPTDLFAVEYRDAPEEDEDDEDEDDEEEDEDDDDESP